MTHFVEFPKIIIYDSVNWVIEFYPAVSNQEIEIDAITRQSFSETLK